MKYLTLFSLRINHDYYTDGSCPDFSIEPDAQTKKRLQNHRCIMRASPGALQVLIREDNLLPISAGTLFCFLLRLDNPQFPSFTNLTKLEPDSAPLFTNNPSGDSTGDLTLASRKARSTEPFVVTQPSATDRYTLSGRPLEGQDEGFKITGSPNVSFKGYESEGRVVTLDSLAAAPGERFTLGYPIPPTSPRGVFAEVEIHADNSFSPPPQTPTTYQIDLTARAVHWGYYLVTDLAQSGGDEPTLEINESAPLPGTAAISFSEKKRTILEDSHLADPDPVIRWLAQQYPRKRLFFFMSDSSIPCRHASRALEMKWDDQSLMTMLPNPSYQNSSRIKKAEQDDDLVTILYQVVKQITYPLPMNGA